jgi:hypothetical protein
MELSARPNFTDERLGFLLLTILRCEKQLQSKTCKKLPKSVVANAYQMFTSIHKHTSYGSVLKVINGKLSPIALRMGIGALNVVLKKEPQNKD